MRKSIVRIIVTGLMLILYTVFAQTLVLMPSFVGGKSPSVPLTTAIVFIIVFGGLIYLLYSIYANWLRHDHNTTYGLTPFNQQRFRFMLLMILALILVQVAGSLLTASGLAPEASNQQELIALSKQFPVALALIAVVGAPPVEEFIFRALLMNSFPDTTRAWRIARVLISAAAFGLVHAPTEPLNFLVYAGMGAVFAVTYQYTKDIRYSIVLHFLNNFLAIFV